MTAVTRDGAPVAMEGDGPGHVPVALEDCEFVEFSPTEEFAKVIDHVRAQAG
ncbi:hypothetical protein [Streptomyces sp. NPDC054829]|jgi:hypothetical protein